MASPNISSVMVWPVFNGLPAASVSGDLSAFRRTGMADVEQGSSKYGTCYVSGFTLGRALGISQVPPQHRL